MLSSWLTARAYAGAVRLTSRPNAPDEGSSNVRFGSEADINTRPGLCPAPMSAMLISASALLLEDCFKNVSIKAARLATPYPHRKKDIPNLSGTVRDRVESRPCTSHSETYLCGPWHQRGHT
jgi:hypothetical protein